MDIEIQSGVAEEVPLGESTPIATTQQENIQFEEAPSTMSLDASGTMDPTYALSTDEAASLAKYLERPVKIHSFTWNESDTFTTTPTSFTPWSLYFNNSYIKNKLQNFSRVRCKLHLTFRFNASPFYYGSMRANYDPLNTGKFDPKGIPDLISISQTPGVYIEPQCGSSVEMTLPFLYYFDWLDTSSLSNFANMGKIFFEVYAPLRSANGVTGTGITVTTYAQAVDVEIAGPTIKSVLQSGIISGPASAVATAASNYVSDVKIGPYAKAVKVGATMVASIAKTFGFSNAPITSDVNPVQNKVFHAFANTETRVPIDKLSLDPGNQVTLDNSVAGIANDDELDILSIVTRPSYIGAVEWSDSATPGTRLCFGKVSPSMFLPWSGTNVTYYNPTPAGWVAEMFRFWRGGMKYHFRVIRSKYQKGRLIFNWDPNTPIDASNVETALFSKVFDLSSPDQGFDVVIPYKAISPWLKCLNINFFTTNVPSSSPDRNNGCWQISVVNALTGAALTNTVTILAYASCCEDMEFAAPKALPLRYAQEVQSGPIDGSAIESADRITDFTVGERIKSLRVLLHRTTLSIQQSVGQSAGYTGFSPGRYHASNFYATIPPEPGFTDPALFCNFNKAKGGIVPATIKPANFCKMHPINWILMAFAGYRGSVNVHASVSTNGILENMNNMSITRIDHSPIISSSSNQTNSMWTRSTLTDTLEVEPNTLTEVNASGVPFVPAGNGGSVVTHGRTQMALSANIPQYCPGRFWPAYYKQRYNYPMLGETYDGFRIDLDYFVPEGTSATSLLTPTVKLFWSAGVDFNTVFFTGVPRMSEYTMDPTV